ncbi:MAG TPA: response regulator [Candidatus Acidoferrum sp.]|nr:response regulator [Candidatus Methylomirabilis sp.]HWU37935.1 response regulator [Candidatus Acidoferrum sp.]
MASVLIVEDDGLLARHLAQALHKAGHTTALASDGCSALQEIADRPDVVLLDLGLPDVSGEKLLNYLRSRPETADTPVLVITGQRDAVVKLKMSVKDIVSDVLLKPVSGAQLCRAVEVALEGRHGTEAEARRLLHERQKDLIQRILMKGPDHLVFQVCLRLSNDRLLDGRPLSEEAVTWSEIADWAEREALVNAEEANLLRRVSLTPTETV